jgi:chromosome segregation ATPase
LTSHDHATDLTELPPTNGVPHEPEARIAELERERRVLAARAEALAADVVTARAERDSLRAELVTARAERDRLRLRLLDAELALAAGSQDEEGAVAASPEDTQRAMLAEQRAGELARELAATRQTLSWRVTKPLRVVRRKIPR